LSYTLSKKHLATLIPLFPYTTLFRSLAVPIVHHPVILRADVRGLAADAGDHPEEIKGMAVQCAVHDVPVVVKLVDVGVQPVGIRSEEHTSELQSRENLVCRLLLEKKK